MKFLSWQLIGIMAFSAHEVATFAPASSSISTKVASTSSATSTSSASVLRMGDESRATDNREDIPQSVLLDMHGTLASLFGSDHKRASFFTHQYSKNKRTPEYVVHLTRDPIMDIPAPVKGFDAKSLYDSNDYISLRIKGSRDLLDKNDDEMDYDKFHEHIQGGRRPPTLREAVKTLEKHVAANNRVAMRQLAHAYKTGDLGLEQNILFALPLLVKAAELGCRVATMDLGWTLLREDEDGHVPIEQRMGFQRKGACRAWGIALLESAAKMGQSASHHLLGMFYRRERQHGMLNHPFEKIVGHFSFAARCGSKESLKMLQFEQKKGNIGKKTLEEIREAYEEAAKIEWSEEREPRRAECGSTTQMILEHFASKMKAVARTSSFARVNNTRHM